MRSFATLFVLAAQACLGLAASPADWRSRSIYFIMTDRFARTDGSTTAPCDVSQGKYCGGTWRGLIKKLDYIKGMGFTAIWITPVTQNIETQTGFEGYHGYWQNNLYKLNSHLGTPDDLKALSRALHARGMYLMVDVVANHFGAEQPPDAVDYSLLTPFNKKDYFHTPCDPDYSNQTSTEVCWLAYGQHVNLPDVNTTQSVVRSTYNRWISNLVRTYGIDGLRVDTMKHVEKPFWPGFNRASGVYNVGEVFSGDRNYLCDYQNYMDGVLNYALYYPLLRAFQSTSGSMSDLAAEINGIKTTCKDTTLLGSFMENHDNARFPSMQSDIAQAKNGIALILLADGVPIIYYGQEQHFDGANDPYDREALWLSGYNTNAELYKSIAAINKFRNHVVSRDRNFVTYKMWPIYTDDHTIVLRKDNVISAYTNQGTGGAAYTITIPNTGYRSNAEIIDILTCKRYKTGVNGDLTISLSNGQPAIFYPTSRLSRSGICGYGGSYGGGNGGGGGGSYGGGNGGSYGGGSNGGSYGGGGSYGN